MRYVVYVCFIETLVKCLLHIYDGNNTNDPNKKYNTDLIFLKVYMMVVMRIVITIIMTAITIIK